MTDMPIIENKAGHCDHSEEVLSYLYRELAAAEMARFEDHLPGCEACTDEFASLCDPRYSVYEWQREEFAPLETPVFENPALTANATASAHQGIFSGIATLISTIRFPVYSAGFAAIAILLGIGTYVLFFAVPKGEVRIASVPGNDDVEIASNASRQMEPAISTGNTEEPTTYENNSTVSRSVDNVEPPEKSDAPTDSRSVVTRVRHTPVSRAVPASTDTSRSRGGNAMQTAREPVLSEFEMPVDESPRLTDLFDQVGSES